MTKDRKGTKNQNDRQTPTEPDMGNDMSDRAGDYDESDSGLTDTATFYSVGIPIGSDIPEQVLNPDGTGTTFGDGTDVPLDTTTESDA